MKNSYKNKLHSALARNRQALGTRTAKVGGYSFVLCLVVLAILIAVNVLVGMLPSRFTQLDISAAQLYSLTADTKVVATNLEQDVTIYWIVQAGEEDTVIEKLLDRYGDLSEHITVVKKDPDVYPTFAQQYTDQTVTNNSLVVESGEKSRYIAYEEITATDYDALRPDEVLALDWDAVTSVDFTLDDTVYTLTHSGDTWTINDTEVEFDEGSSAVDALAVSEFNSEEPAKKQEITFAVHLDNETWPTLTVALYQYDGESCLATLDGETLGLVDRSLAVDLTEAVNAITLGLE